MAFNQLHHDKALTALFIEAKFAKGERRWSRFGRRGETNGGAWIQDARKRYNKAHRKASRVQLSRYNAAAPHVEYSPVFTWPDDSDFPYFVDSQCLRTEADAWYEAKRFDNWD